jgi:AhpD family alkylhydroperoxidase
MQAKLNPYTAAPEIMKPWMALADATNDLLEHSLAELVKMRASILNGCANCVNMHSADALAAGETQQRLLLLSAWHEAPCYTPRERAALAWTEALTLLAETHAPDEAYRGLKAHFTEPEQVALTLLIVAINGWNRVQVGFRGVPAVEKQKAA